MTAIIDMDVQQTIDWLQKNMVPTHWSAAKREIICAPGMIDVVIADLRSREARARVRLLKLRSQGEPIDRVEMYLAMAGSLRAELEAIKIRREIATYDYGDPTRAAVALLEAIERHRDDMLGEDIDTEPHDKALHALIHRYQGNISS